MAHILYLRKKRIDLVKKVKGGQEGEQQQINSDLKEYSRAIC